MAKDIVTGITLARGCIQWTKLRKVRKRYAVVGSDSLAITLEDDEAPDLFTVAPDSRAAVSSQIKQKGKAIEGRVAVAIPSDQALLRVVELPTKDRTEILSMVELQVDKFSPFPSDNTVHSFELLNETETGTRVLIACVHRRLVEGIGDILTRARVFPHCVDLELLCRWRLMCDTNSLPGEGCHIALLNDQGTYELVATREGVPVLFRSLGKADDLSPEDVVEEIDYTLTTLEADHGITNVGSIVVWHRGDEPLELTSLMSTKLAQEIGTQSFDSLPPLTEGLARRALETTGTKLDLALDEWHSDEMKLAMQRRLTVASIAVLVLWSAGAGGVFAWSKLQTGHLERQKEQLAKVEEMAAPIHGMRRMLLETEQYTNRTHSALECIREVTEKMPGKRQLEFFRLFRYDNTKGRRVVVQGEGSDRNSILNYGNALRDSALFAHVEVDGPREIRPGRYSFTITMKLPK